MDTKTYIQELVKRARKAQETASYYTQEKVDELAAAITWEIAANPALVEELAKFSYEECRLGDIASKISKVSIKCRGVFYDVKNTRTVGVVEEIPEKGLQRVAKPVGVIASLVPSTQSEMHPIIQAIFAVKARDAVIFSPHPRGKRTTARVVEYIRNVMQKYDAPKDLFLSLEEPSLEKNSILMQECDLVMATGGAWMVKAAYSSGTPAFGVGVGNAVIVVDKTADLADAAGKIYTSKTFDLAAGCSCDNSLVIQEDVYDEMLTQLQKTGAYLVKPEEKEKLQKAIWPNWPNDHVINRDIVASPADHIAKLADLKIRPETAMFLVEEDKSGAASPFAGEKMCLVIAVYKFKEIEDAIAIINENHAYSGAGHSCGIFSKMPENIQALSLKTFTTRVVVNLPQAVTNTGSWVSGMPFTSSLGCGTWGSNIASENIALKHYLNNTWIIREIADHQPTDEELFAGFTPR